MGERSPVDMRHDASNSGLTLKRAIMNGTQPDDKEIKIHLKDTFVEKINGQLANDEDDEINYESTHHDNEVVQWSESGQIKEKLVEISHSANDSGLTEERIQMERSPVGFRPEATNG